MHWCCTEGAEAYVGDRMVVDDLADGLFGVGGWIGSSLFLGYSPSYFAAFLIDPDGNNIEAVCT